MSPLASPTVPYIAAKGLNKTKRWCKSFIATIKTKPMLSLAFTSG
jgi:hypothetical protein